MRKRGFLAVIFGSLLLVFLISLASIHLFGATKQEAEAESTQEVVRETGSDEEGGEIEGIQVKSAESDGREDGSDAAEEVSAEAVAAGNWMTEGEVSENGITGKGISEDVISENRIPAETLLRRKDRTVSGNDGSGSPVSGNNVSGNGISENSISENDISEKRLLGASISENDSLENRISEKNLSESGVSQNTVSENQTSGNQALGNEISADTTSGNSESGKLASGNEISADTTSGNAGSENQASGNAVSADTTSGNAVSGNLASGSVISGNTTSESAVSENLVSGNEMSADTISGNTVSGNLSCEDSVSGNLLSGNNVSENTVSGNGVSGNTAGRALSENAVMTLAQRQKARSSHKETLLANTQDRATISGNCIDFSNIKIACLGDSITEASNLERLENYKELSYPAALEKALGAREVYNLGIGGSSIGRYWADAFVDRYQEIPQDTDLILVMGGTNDGFCASMVEFGTSTERKSRTFWGDLDELMDGLAADYPHAEVIFLTPLPNGLHDYLKKDHPYLISQEKYAQVIGQLAAEHGMEVIDLYNSNILDGHDKDNALHLMPDSVHPNVEGYRILGEHVAAEIIRLLEKRHASRAGYG